jgi:hypothetical protein
MSPLTGVIFIDSGVTIVSYVSRSGLSRGGSQSLDPATTGRLPRASSRGRGEHLNDRFPAPSLGLAST